MRVWWVPVVLLLAPALGRVTAPRDVAGFFAPMRQLTAQHLLAGELPWMNPANGCGEAWFANPETGVLYPPHLAYLALPLEWGITLEVALHLALLSLGCGLLARRWGASDLGRTVAEATAWTAGPVLSTVGVLNNLDALAWVPWLILAAGLQGRRVVPAVASVTALGWLAGEPQVVAIGVVVAVLGARSRRLAAAGAALGLAVVAVQLVPFAAWVMEGDRGPLSPQHMLEGGVSVAAWWGLLSPELPVAVAEDRAYLASLFIGPALLGCLLLGARQKRALAAAALLLAVLATLPTTGAAWVYRLLTGGFLRFPARFAAVAVILVLPAVGRGVDSFRRGEGTVVAAVLAALSLGVCALLPGSVPVLTAVVPAVVLLLAVVVGRYQWLRLVAVGLGLAGAALASVPLLGLSRAERVTMTEPAWPEARGGDRLYTPAIEGQLHGFLAQRAFYSRLWPSGYFNLLDGMTLARTSAPVSSRRLEQHLGEVDQGPEHRWWLDTLAARWVLIAPGRTPEEMRPIRQRGGLVLLQNLRALPTVSLAASPPVDETAWQGVGSRIGLARTPARLHATLACDRDSWAWVSLPPVRGWRWRLDGRPVSLAQGPGIVQYLRVPAGQHRLEGRYAPPAVPPATTVSLCAVVVLAWLAFRARGELSGKGQEQA